MSPETNSNLTDLPGGTVTFLFTDIQGSTELLKQLNESYAFLLADQREILRTAFEKWDGREIDTQGDAFFASFPRATQAVAAVVEIQRALANHDWPEGVEVRVRMGLHTGEPWLVEEGYVGMDVHRAARIAHVGHGGQVLLSETTSPLVQDELPEGVSLLDLGRHRLKDLRRPEHLHQLVVDGLPSEFPPLNSLEVISTPGGLEMETGGRPPREVGPSPYRGLAAFQEQDAQFFFGREAFTAQLADAIQKHNLVAVVVGSSGSGKSSAVFAGLLPQLRGTDGWLIIQLRPGGSPFQSLARALVPSLDDQLGETERLVEAQRLAGALQAGEVSLYQVIERILERHSAARRVLLFIDQFEELFTLNRDPGMQVAFLDELLATAQAGELHHVSPVAFLLTLRADFMGQALTHRPFADALQEGSLMLGPMNRDELRTAIEKPAELQGAAFEPGLVTRILDDVGQEPGNLPLLEFALTLLWDQMEAGWMTHKVYDQIGRVEGALARYADQVYSGLSSREQEGARRTFVQLVQPGQGTEDTRRVARRADLVGVDWGLVQHLADQRLVVTGLDETGKETVEVVHEALIRGWGQLRAWMATDRDFRNWQEGLRVALRGWESSGRDEGALLRGAPLAQAEEWLGSRGDQIGDAERAYIQASLDYQQARQAQRERRRRLIIGGLAIGLVVALLLSLFAFSQRSAAQQNAQRANQNAATAQAERARAEDESDARATQQALAEAERARAEDEALARATQQAIAEEQARVAFSRELASASINNLDEDPELSILLALQGLSHKITVEAENALHQAIQASPIRQTFTNQDTGSIWITASPDGQRLFVSGPGGGTMWDIANGEVIFTFQVPEQDWINRAAFTPDGAYLILPGESYDEDGNTLPGSVTILDAQTGHDILSFIAHDSSIQEVAINPDGTSFATVSDDQSVKIWDLEATLAEENGQLNTTLCCSEDWWYVRFNHDGKDIVTSPVDGYAVIWDVDTGQERFRIGPDIDPVAYSPDGQYLASVSDVGLLQVWDAVTGKRFSSAQSHDETIANNITFSSDGSMLATSKLSGEVILWSFSPDGLQEIQTLHGHTDQAGGAVFSLDGHYLYTSSADGTTKAWDISPNGKAEIAVITDITGFNLIPDGKTLISSGDDGMLRLWEIQTGNEVKSIQAYDGEFSFDISPDGKLLAAGGRDGLVKIWDTASWEVLHTLEAHEVQEDGFFSGVMDVSFSPDGRRLASGGVDGEVYIWDVATGDKILNLSGHTGWAVNVLFSPNGELLASSSSTGDAAVKLWDANTGQLLQTLSPDDWMTVNTGIWGVDISPDGSHLVLGRSDGIVEIWQLPGTPWDNADEALLTNKLQSRSGFVFSTRFHPDGERIALAGLTGVVELRDATNGDIHLSLQFPDSQNDLEFSPDGKMLVTIGFDGIARLFALDTDELVKLAQSRVTRTLNDEECQTYLHLEDCPEE